MFVKNIMAGRAQNPHICKEGLIPGEKTAGQKADNSRPIKAALRGRGAHRRVKGAERGSPAVRGIISMQGPKPVGPDMPPAGFPMPGDDQKVAVELAGGPFPRDYLFNEINNINGLSWKELSYQPNIPAIRGSLPQGKTMPAGLGRLPP